MYGMRIAVVFFAIGAMFFAHPVMAQESDTNTNASHRSYMPLVMTASKISYDEVMSDYNLQQVDTIPNGVVPIEVNSPEELATLMQNLTTQIPSDDSLEIDAAYLTSPYCQAMSTGVARLRVHADIDIQGGRIVQRYGVRAVLSGVTYGLAMSDGWGYFTSGNTEKRATWSGGATIHVYILLNTGMTTVYSTPYRCSGLLAIP